MKTRREFIIAAYGKNWEALKDQVDADGWVHRYYKKGWHGDAASSFGYQNGQIQQESESLELGLSVAYKWRPDTLRALDYNNGWVTIDGPDTLPKERTVYDTWHKRFNERGVALFSPENPKIVAEWLRYYSHWREIPAKPLFKADPKGGDK